AQFGFTRGATQVGGREIEIVVAYGSLELVRAGRGQEDHRSVRVEALDRLAGVRGRGTQQRDDQGLILDDPAHGTTGGTLLTMSSMTSPRPAAWALMARRAGTRQARTPSAATSASCS